MPGVLALIPARGGSKGIPRKNALKIAGRPLVAYSIEHALSSTRITRTIVSTDDEEIADIARRFGAEVPFMRPAEFATDLATDFQVFEHALTHLSAEEGYEPDLVVHLRPTDPVRQVAVLDRAIATLQTHPEADSLKSVTPAVLTPFKMWKIEQGQLVPFATLPEIPEAHSMPRQMLPPVFQGSGYVDIVRPRTVLEQHSMCGQHILPFVVEDHAYDLDYPEQLLDVERALLHQRDLGGCTAVRASAPPLASGG